MVEFLNLQIILQDLEKVIGVLWNLTNQMEAFLKVQPTYSIITNIDREHMDYYKSMNKLLNLFGEYINKVPSFGKSFICIDDINNSKLIKSLKIKNYNSYGTHKKSNFRISKLKQTRDRSTFDLIIICLEKKLFQ